MLGENLHITTEYLTQEAKVASLTSKMEAMEVETSKLKQSLIESMGKVGNFVNHSLVAPLRVVGKERHIISSGGC